MIGFEPRSGPVESEATVLQTVIKPLSWSEVVRFKSVLVA